jgi:adenosylcobinamide-phosphate synthase
MLLFAAGSAGLVLYLCMLLHPVVYVIVGGVLCWQCLAAKSLKVESEKVYKALKEGGLQSGRDAVAMIVGRDVNVLDEDGVVRAAVETVAENTSDGEIAPLLYMALFGPVGGCVYKAINTMDSMLGYRNERYERFGTVAARLDDVANFVPARFAALIMMVASAAVGLNAADALRIWKRDRYKHASPNSAQTESVMAGALEVRLAGDAVYGGVVHKKEYIGDDIRPIEIEDIHRSQRLMTVTSVLAFAAAVIVRMLVYLV